MQIALRCQCHALRGQAVVKPKRVSRAVCYCDDCQCYALHLGRDGLLDEHGGTEVMQTSPSTITLTEGLEHLAAVRLSPKGTVRWYASCCNTPIANVPANAKIPFAGVVHAFIDKDAEFEEALPVRARVRARYAKGEPEGAHQDMPRGFLFRTVRTLAAAFFRREYQPSPFFDGKDWTRKPTIVTRDEREALRTQQRAL